MEGWLTEGWRGGGMERRRDGEMERWRKVRGERVEARLERKVGSVVQGGIWGWESTPGI